MEDHIIMQLVPDCSTCTLNIPSHCALGYEQYKDYVVGNKQKIISLECKLESINFIDNTKIEPETILIRIN